MTTSRPLDGEATAATPEGEERARAVAGRDPGATSSAPPIRVVLFDLDGTLLDSAPDMLATVNRMRRARGTAPMALADLRPHVSRGSRAMSAAAFPELGDAIPADLITEFLSVYAEELGRHSLLFDGVAGLLDAIEAAGMRWAIVTNKPEALATRVLPAFGWESRCGILIGGDTLEERKPHPLPLLHAARFLGVAPAECIYVGDDRRDIDAARAAGMRSVVALWGYRADHDDPCHWGADAMSDGPGDVLALL